MSLVCVQKKGKDLEVTRKTDYRDRLVVKVA